MPGTKRRGIMGSILDKVVSAVHKRANKSLRRRENHRVRAQPRRRLRDRSRDSPRGPSAKLERDRGHDRGHVSFESDSSFSSTDSSSASSTEPSLTEPKRYVDDRYYDPDRITYRDRGRGRERKEPESDSTRGPDLNRALPGSRVLLHPAVVQAERDWPMNKPLPTTPVPQPQSEPQVERNWPLMASTIPRGAISSIPILSERPDQQSNNNSENKNSGWAGIPDDDEASQSTNLDGESGSESMDSDLESNISFDEWEDPEEYQRRLAAKKTKKDKRKGRVMQVAESDAEAGPSKLPASQAQDQADNRPMSGASTAPSWLEEVMTPYYSISNASEEHVHKEEADSSDIEISTKEQVREGKRPEKPVHLGQIIVEEYHASPVARNYSIRRKPVGSAPSRKMTTGSNTVSNLSGSVKGPGSTSAHGESLQAIPENNQITHIPTEVNATPLNRPNFSYPLKRDSNREPSQYQPPGQKRRRLRLNSHAPESRESPADDRRPMGQPRYNYIWDS